MFLFQFSILNIKFWSVASFLDPRFQNLTEDDDLQSIKTEVQKYVQHPNAVIKPNKIKNEQKYSTEEKLSSSSQKITGLSFLINKRNIAGKRTRDRFEIEFDSYVADVDASLEQCPLQWWHMSKELYPNLYQAADKFACVPANMHTGSIEQQIDLYDKRVRLDSSLINELVYLNHNV